MGLQTGVFCHHHLVTMSAHIHVYCYPLFKTETVCELLDHLQKIYIAKSST